MATICFVNNKPIIEFLHERVEFQHSQPSEGGSVASNKEVLVMLEERSCHLAKRDKGFGHCAFVWDSEQVRTSRT